MRGNRTSLEPVYSHENKKEWNQIRNDEMSIFVNISIDQLKKG